MRASTRIFAIIGGFFLIVAIGYMVVTGVYEPFGVEPVGSAALLGLSGLGFMIGTYLHLTGRKHRTLPEDDLDGELDDGAGVQGSFSPGSWAPLWVALGAGLCFLGVAAGWWILALGAIIAGYGVILWVLEFSIGVHRH